MTVGELQKKLEGLEPKTHIVIYSDTEGETEFFEVSDASLSRGTPKRHADGKVGFTFDHTGPATWFFLSIEEA